MFLKACRRQPKRDDAIKSVPLATHGVAIGTTGQHQTGEAPVPKANGGTRPVVLVLKYLGGHKKVPTLLRQHGVGSGKSHFEHM